MVKALWNIAYGYATLCMVFLFFTVTSLHDGAGMYWAGYYAGLPLLDTEALSLYITGSLIEAIEKRS